MFLEIDHFDIVRMREDEVEERLREALDITEREREADQGSPRPDDPGAHETKSSSTGGWTPGEQMYSTHLSNLF
jgi:hypothetical protein